MTRYQIFIKMTLLPLIDPPRFAAALLFLLAAASSGPLFSEEPEVPPHIQAFINAPIISIVPQNLRPGDQAVLIIISRFQRGQSKPIELRQFEDGASIEATDVFHRQEFEPARNPDSQEIHVYRVTLKKKSYTFAESDFINLPNDFKFPELRIFRTKS